MIPMGQTPRSHICMIPALHQYPGRCGVCGHMVLIRFKDDSTGSGYGFCCMQAALAAERALDETVGLRHPVLGERVR
jgi:hypothetical protein